MSEDNKKNIEIQPRAIIDPCEIECEDSCESSCQTYCQSHCQSTCQRNCQNYCELHCQTTCEVNCQNCLGACETGCQVDCMSTCELSCQVGCQISCQTTCERSCQSTCEISCQSTCEISCQNCLGACESTCEKSCQNKCETSCQGYCELNCETACESSCQTTCQLDCQYACEDSCQSTCQKSCQSTCQKHCQSTCQTSCQCSGEGCQTTCESSCQDTCMLGCQDECELNCMNHCQLNCETTCELSCQCSGEGCMTLCEESCQCSTEICDGCQEVCEVDCMTSCELGCQCSGEGCMTQCEQSCQCSTEVCDGCQDGCEVDCMTTCELSCQCSGEGCMTQCEQSCQCNIEGCESCQCIDEGCMTACERDCQTQCEICETQCEICEDQCEICETQCEFCETKCELNCMDECEINCMNLCEDSCQCNTEICDGCQDGCEIDCMTSCELGCQTICQQNCESTCQVSCQSLSQLEPDTDYYREYIHYGSEGINFGTGNLSFTNVDMSISAPGFDLNFSRTYNSRNDRETRAFGKGWTFGFEGKAEGDSTVAVALPNGSVQMFSKNANDTFTALDSRNKLEINGEGNYILITKDQYKYEFNSDGYLSLMSDRNGNSVFIEVDSDGKIIGVTDQADRHYTISYNSDNLVDKITEDITQREVTYVYDTKKLIKVIDSMGNETNYSYDSEGYLIEIKDHSDNILKTIEYDHSSSTYQHKITKLIDEYGNEKNYSYDVDNKKATITDSNGRTTIMWYDEYNYEIKVQDPEGLQTIKEYFMDDNENKYGDIKSITDRNGNKTEYERDSRGNVTKKINPDLSTVEYSYDENNNLTNEKDENGNYSFYIYDGENKNLIKKAQPLNGTDLYTDGCDESLFAITEYIYYTETEETQLGYKGKSLLKSTIDPEDNQIDYTYYPDGKIKTIKDPETGQVTTLEYNNIGWKTGKVTAMGYRTEYTYDKNGLLEKTILISDKDETTVINYDVMGRKIKEITPNLYNLEDDAVPYQYSGDYGYRYEYYSASGKLWKETDPENNTIIYTYDKYGNMKTKTLPNDAIYTYEYDVMNRVKKVYFKEGEASGASLLEEYIYEILPDKKTSVTHKRYTSTSEYTEITKIYDYAERVVEKQNPDGSKITIAYNDNGNINSSTDENGSISYFRYDGLNRVTDKWIPFEESEGITLYTYTKIEYYKNGKKKARRIGKEKVELFQYPNSLVSEEFEYYKNGKIKKSTDSHGRRTDYYYDYDGNVNKIEKHIDATNKTIVEFTNNYIGSPDEKREYISSGDIYGNDFNSVETTTLVTSYEYDKNGNIVSITTPDLVTTTFEYDKLDRKIKTIKSGLDEYDNPVSIEVTKTYNWEGKPLSITDGNINTTTYHYNKRGLLEKLIDANSGITSYYYDLAGRKIAEVSPKNYDPAKEISELNRAEYTYDSMDRIIAKTDIFQEKQMDSETYQWNTVNVNIISKAYKYDNKGNVIKELDALGIENGTGETIQEKIDTGYGIEKKYNLGDKLIEILDPEAKDSELQFTGRIEYDSLGRKVSETNAKGVKVIFDYDDGGNPIAKKIKKDDTASEYTKESFIYDLLDNVLTKTDGNGNTIIFEYNNLGKVRKETHPSDSTIAENVITYQYDLMGNLRLKENSLGKQEIYEYDNQGRVISAASQKNDGTNGITITKKYDKNGNVRFEADGNGNVTEKTYDSLNRIETITKSVRDINNNETIHKETYVYDKNGNNISKSDWRNNTYNYIYDSINRLVEKINPEGVREERIEYYHNNMQWRSYDALNNVKEFIYDKNGRTIKIIDPEGHETNQSYDYVGNLLEKKDGENNSTAYDYDELNRLTTVTNAKDEVTSYEYDLVGNRTKIINGEGNTTTIEYNVANMIMKRIDHGGRIEDGEDIRYDNTKVESYTYYSDGSLKTKTDRNSNTTTYIYDIHGRLILEEVGSLSKAYTYDNNGNKLTVTNDVDTITRTYDELNRVKTKHLQNNGTISFIYDIIDNIEVGYIAEKTIDPKGNETLRIYDKAKRLKEVISDGKTTVYTYYDNGNKESVTYQDGTKEEFTYTKDNQLSSLVNKRSDGTIIEAFSYGYDAAHNQIWRTDHKGTTSYTYDQLNRIETITEPNGKATSYIYDKAGNRKTEEVTLNSDTDLTTYNYNDQSRLITSVLVKFDGSTETIAYTYDNNGNIIKEEKEVIVTGLAPVITTVDYTYDENNQLIETVKGGSITKAKYNGEGLRVEREVDGQNTSYLYEGNKVILEIDDQGNEKARNIYGSSLLQRIVGVETVSYLYNGHGDVTALIDDSGNIQGTYYYDAFGNQEEETGDIDNPYRYAGYQYDEEIDHYYLNSRYYDPKIARFLTEDTYRGQTTDPLSLNLYTYSLNNPIVYIDPSGHRPVRPVEEEEDNYGSNRNSNSSNSSSGSNNNSSGSNNSSKNSNKDTSSSKPSYNSESEELFDNIKSYKESKEYRDSVSNKKQSNELTEKTYPQPSPKEPVEEKHIIVETVQDKDAPIVNSNNTRDNVVPPEAIEEVIIKKPNNRPNKTGRTDRNVVDPETVEELVVLDKSNKINSDNVNSAKVINGRTRGFEYNPDKDYSNKMTKVGKGINLNINALSNFGVDAIWFDPEDLDTDTKYYDEINDTWYQLDLSKPVIYYYSGFEINEEAGKIIYNKVNNKLQNTSLTSSVSFGMFLVSADKRKFDDATDYEGEFIYGSVGAFHISATYATGPNNIISTEMISATLSPVTCSGGRNYYHMIPQNITNQWIEDFTEYSEREYKGKRGLKYIRKDKNKYNYTPRRVTK